MTNYFGESTTFYRNLGRGLFADHSSAIGLAAPTRQLLGFGIAFLDVDNDGRLDVLSANGHVLDPRPRIPWMMPLQVLLAARGGRLVDVSASAGAPFQPLHLGRGLAVGDLDNDGGSTPSSSVRTSRSSTCTTEPSSTGISSRSASRARSRIATPWGRGHDQRGGPAPVAQRFGGGSYQSASDPRIHFGLGEASTGGIHRGPLAVGQVDRHPGLAADRTTCFAKGARCG